ncbi:hypothetical protein BDZ97DRAFT_1805529 [Flammula alnicola]|nr:hypothetical protein BDZ97DRAFT_1805529 [Flammula alnicola]
MLLFAGLLLRILAFGTQVAPTHGLKFNFMTVEQCDPVVMTFSGSNITTVPTSLSILPINSTAIVVPLQNPSLISIGIALSFLPIPAGSNFIASLDDSEGDNLISVSDLIRVLPSPTGNSACLPAQSSAAPQRFTLGSAISQCEEVTINYDTSVISKAPTVRLYDPKGPSFLLNMTSDNPANGSATYVMNFFRGKEIVLLMDDGGAIRETSPLITVGGDSASSSSCFQRSAANTTGVINPDTLDGTPIVSRSVIIGSATGGTAVVLIALFMVIFVVRDHRRRRQRNGLQFDPSLMERGPDNEKASPNVGLFARYTPRPSSNGTNNGMVSDPIYTSTSFLSPSKSKMNRDSMASWAQVIPEDQQYPTLKAATSSLPSPRIVVQSPQSSDRLSLESLDIEGMLNMATLQSENYAVSRKNSDASVLGPMIRSPSLTVPTPTFLRPETSRRHLRNPSDVPAGPDSMTFSGYFLNPFDVRDSTTGSILQGPLRTDDSIRSHESGLGLPTSPRDVRVSRVRVISDVNSRSRSDWYGMAR